MNPEDDTVTPAGRRWKILFRVTLIVAILVCANFVAQWLHEQLQVEANPTNEHVIHRIIITSLLIYTLLIAIPFVPSVEIGLGLMMVLGADLAPLVYMFTVLGLSLSFILGCIIPESSLQSFLEDLSLEKAGRLVERLRGLNTDERLALLVSHAPAKFIPNLMRHRYVAVALALNIPGNTVIGGGGGIALIAGMSRLFNFWQFALMLVIAVAPVPLIIIFYGTDLFH